MMYLNSYRYTLAAPTDADAQAYIDVLTAPSAALISALHVAFIALKFYGLYAKIHVWWAMFGGSAADHKWNAVNPLNSDVANRLVFYGGWTHNSDGGKGNGANAYAATFFDISARLTNDDEAMIYFSGTAAGLADVCMGTVDTGVNAYQMIPRWTNGISYTDNSRYDTQRVSVAHGSAEGMLMSSRISSTSHVFSRDDTVIGTATGTGGNVANFNYDLGLQAQNSSSGYGAFSARICKTAMVTKGMDATDRLNLKNILTTLNLAR